MSRPIVTTNAGTPREFERTPAPPEVRALFEPYDPAVTPTIPEELAFRQHRRVTPAPVPPAVISTDRRFRRAASASAPWAIVIALIFVGLRLPLAQDDPSAATAGAMQASPAAAPITQAQSAPPSTWILTGQPSVGALVISVVSWPPEAWVESVAVLVSSPRWSSSFTISLSNAVGSIRIPVVASPVAATHSFAVGDPYTIQLAGSAQVVTGIVPAWAAFAGVTPAPSGGSPAASPASSPATKSSPQVSVAPRKASR